MNSTSNKLVVDAHAWISYFDGDNPQVSRYIDNSELHTSVVNLIEVASRFERRGIAAEEAVSAISQLSTIWGAGTDESVNIAKLHAKMRKKIPDFGLGDCFVLELAERLNAKILTGDKHFKGMPNVIFI